jgi:hypothetical protein
MHECVLTTISLTASKQLCTTAVSHPMPARAPLAPSMRRQGQRLPADTPLRAEPESSDRVPPGRNRGPGPAGRHRLRPHSDREISHEQTDPPGTANIHIDTVANDQGDVTGRDLRRQTGKHQDRETGRKPKGSAPSDLGWSLGRRNRPPGARVAGSQGGHRRTLAGPAGRRILDRS